jgi:Raf kinase inhibitor-like YbhB/YbcL family protein
MQLTSSAFENGQEMPQKYGKKLENISLPLSWSAVPAGTKSFAVSIVDKHPVARNYVHWMVADVGANVTSLPEGASSSGMPAGAKELKLYAGPFPPSGTHKYEITLYALKTERLVLPSKVNLEIFTEAAEQNAIATATLTSTFTKVKA